MEDLSPYARFMAALCGWIVVDKTTQRPIPKFILWEKFGKSTNNITLITTKTHDGFDFFNRSIKGLNEENTRVKLAMTEQILRRQPFEF